ncbi:MAG: DUF2070 family protein [Candidatus Thermoplasmatota archaeon]|jgi:putative membrane protein|nr:DUF2070 family protein [Candidatus Thermoplasmatota archaeon]MCL5794237.1 DUF2070 family protein [Candidatus Thermoplasmatota archaeon]
MADFERTFADLSKFLRRAPRYRMYPVPLIIISLLDYLFTSDLVFSLIMVIGGFALVSLLDAWVIRVGKFYFPIRRVFYLNFFVLSICSGLFWVLGIFHAGGLGMDYLLLYAFSFTSYVKSMVFYVYYGDTVWKSVLPSLTFFLGEASIFLAYKMSPLPFAVGLAAAIIFSLSGFIFAHLSMSDFRKEFGRSPVKVMNMFLNMHSMGREHQDGLDFFSDIYSFSREIPVSVVDVRRLNGDRKFLMVFPYIHPGPFGEVGSSNLPAKLQARLSDLTNEIMVFHTATTNSNNCGGDSDVDSVASGVRAAINVARESTTISAFTKIDAGEYVAGLQKFGGFILCALVPEKKAFDDIELDEGLKLAAALKDSGAEQAVIVDAQNFFSHRAGPIENIAPVKDQIIKAAEELKDKCIPRFGYARVAMETPGLGSMGIQCYVSDSDGRKDAIVLTDSNNIRKEIIEESRKLLGGVVDSLEIYTTDNHFVNRNTLDMNPLGERDDQDKISANVVKCVKESLHSVEEVKLFHGEAQVTVNMGEKRIFQKLQSVVFASIRKSKYYLIATSLGSLVLSFLPFYLLLA